MVIDGNEQFGLWYLRGNSGISIINRKYYFIYILLEKAENGVYAKKIEVARYIIKDNEYHNMSKCEI